MAAEGWDDMSAAPMEETAPLPYFHFPAAPLSQDEPLHSHRRNVSMFTDSTSHQRVASLERKSASALPTFSFNATDTSGRTNSPPSMSFLDTPSSGRSGHRRGASEYVGGTPRYGLPGLVSATPVRQLNPESAVESLGSPMRRKGHAHRRSAAMSINDMQSILQPRDANIVPLSQQEDFTILKAQASGPVITPDATTIKVEETEEPVIPRPRVGFSSNIEFIPRPLSTISSETESIISAVPPPSFSAASSPHRSPQTGSPAKRKSTSNLSAVELADSTMDDPSTNHDIDGTSPDVVMSGSTTDLPPMSEAAADDFAFPPRKRPTKLDRRKSEPFLSTVPSPRPKRSSISLREPLIIPTTSNSSSEVFTRNDSPMVVRKSSASRVKAWASSMVLRKEKKRPKQRLFEESTSSTADPDAKDNREESASSPEATPRTEPDLEQLFAFDPFSQHDEEPGPASIFTLNDKTNPTAFRPAYGDSEEGNAVIDLDAAFEPSKTPSKSPSFGARRQLHSSRMSRDFNSPGNLLHRRAESAPVLATFDYPKSPSPQNSPMADVFEEEEEEESVLPIVQIMEQSTPTPIFADSDSHADGSSSSRAGSRDSTDDGLGIRDQPFLPPTPMAEPTCSKLPLTADMIVEEVGPVEIVEAHEEPRASVITKSSSSSETATLLAEPVLEPILTNLVPPQAAFMTPSIYTESTVSEPDTTWRQSSFETSRVGTSASSTTDCRTLSSHADERMSVDYTPSLVSGRSRRNTGQRASLQRNVSDRTAASSIPALPTPSSIEQVETTEQRRRKRNSIASLTKLMTSPFGQSSNQLELMQSNASTPNLLSTGGSASSAGKKKKKEKRLSKLMFWKHKASHRSSGD